MTSVKISKSTDPKKKLMAVFTYENGKTKTLHFGSAGMNDFTITGDKERKRLYLERHKKNENWNQFDTRGSLARWILWEKTNLQEAITAYKKRFNLK